MSIKDQMQSYSKWDCSLDGRQVDTDQSFGAMSYTHNNSGIALHTDNTQHKYSGIALHIHELKTLPYIWIWQETIALIWI